MTEEALIARCRKNDRKAQKLLYERYASVFYGLCLRYIKQREIAEDVLMEGFFKVFDKLHTYKGQGSFEGWMRRIIVNEALMHLRKQKHLFVSTEINALPIRAVDLTIEDELAAQDILNLLEALPTGYRTVFNLYVIEGFKHREIAEMLDISINTSKSQLILAKKRLRQLVKQNQESDVQHRRESNS